VKINAIILSKAVNISFRKYEHQVKWRARFLRQIVGRFFVHNQMADREDRKYSPINQFKRATKALVANLAFRNPKVKIASTRLDFKTFAEGLSMSTNHLIQKINLVSTLKLCTLDAILYNGFIKTGIAGMDEWIEGEDEDIQVGQPFAQRVDPDDMILDPMARHWDEQELIGHKFRVPIELLIKSGICSKAEAEKLPNTYNGNDRTTSDTAEALTGERDSARYSVEIERYVDLMELYLPRAGKVITMPYRRDAVQTKFLHVADYEGPERGPYHKLGFFPVPHNLTDASPGGDLYDMHILNSRIARKIARQAERNKRVLAYTDAAQEDANEIAQADDGETVRVNNLDELKEFELGGTGDDAYKWFGFCSQLFDQISGTEQMSGGSSLGGNKGGDPTATQFEGQQANQSVLMADMTECVLTFTKEICSDLAYYLYSDPLLEHGWVKEKVVIDGMGVPHRFSQQVMFQPGDERGEWFYYNLDIKPYSMAQYDPRSSSTAHQQFYTNTIPAVAQAAQMLGPGFDTGVALQIAAREAGIDDVDEFIHLDAMQQHQAMLAALSMGQPDESVEDLNTPTPPGQPGGQIGQPAPGMTGPKTPMSPMQAKRSKPQPAGNIFKQPIRSMAQNLIGSGTLGGQ
jgi:hypothetical protein